MYINKIDCFFKLKSLMDYAVFIVVQRYWNKQALHVTASAVHAKFGILIVFSVTLRTPCKVLIKSGCLH